MPQIRTAFGVQASVAASRPCRMVVQKLYNHKSRLYNMGHLSPQLSLGGTQIAPGHLYC